MHACVGSGTGIPSVAPTVRAGTALMLDSFYIKPKGEFKYKYRGAWMEGNTVRQYFYNFSGSTIDYIDFIHHEHVQLFKVDESLANTMEGIGLLSPDTLVFLLNSGLALYSPQGRLLQEYGFSARERKRAVWDGIYSPLLVTPTGYVYSRRQNKKAVLGYYATADKRNHAIPIAFPAPAEGNAGMLGEHSQAYFHGKVAVLFNVSPDLYVYDLEAKTTRTYSVKSEYDTGFTPFMGGDMREVQNHHVTAGHYYNVTYDPYRDQLLVVYLHPQPLKNGAGYYNDPYMTRNASLIVLDSQLRTKKEYVFPATRCWLFYHPYPTPDGVVLKAAQTNEEFARDGMKYYVMKFE